MIIKQTFTGTTATDNSQEVYNFLNSYCLDMFDNITLVDNVITLTKGQGEITIHAGVNTDIMQFKLANERTAGAGGTQKIITKAMKTSCGVMLYTSNNTAHFFNKCENTVIICNPNDGATFADLNNSTNFTASTNMTKKICQQTAFCPIVVPDSDTPTNGLYYTPFMQYDILGTISTGNLNFAVSGYIAMKD